MYRTSLLALAAAPAPPTSHSDSHSLLTATTQISCASAMLIRRLPQRSLARKAVTLLLGTRVDPAIETLNVVRDNMDLGRRIQRQPELLSQVTRCRSPRVS